MEENKLYNESALTVLPATTDLTYKEGDKVNIKSGSTFKTYILGPGRVWVRLQGITDSEQSRIDKITDSQADKLVGLNTQVQLDTKFQEQKNYTDTKVQQTVGETIAINGTVLPRGNDPLLSHITVIGKSELYGGSGGTTYTNTGQPAPNNIITVEEGTFVPAIYTKSTDIWTFESAVPLPVIPVVDNVKSTSSTSGLSANQGRILNEKIEGGKAVVITGYDPGYLNLTGTISPSSTYRHSKPIPVVEGKTYEVLVSGTSSVLVVGAFANENINSFISDSPVNKVGTQPGSLPYEVVFDVPVGSGVSFVILSSHTSTPLSDLYMIELDDAGIKNRLLKSETKVMTLDKTVYGVEADIPLSWNSGYISLSGVLTPSSSYFNGDFVSVTPGDEYDVLVSGSESTLVISSYSSANQSAFVTGAMSNIRGKGSTAFEVRVKIPQGVYFVKPGRNDNILKAGDVYFRKVDKSSLVSKVETLESNNVTVVSAPKNYFNFRDKAIFSWIWDDLNPSDEQVYNIFRDFNLLPNFALPSRIITSENAKFYKKVYTEGGSILSHDNGSTMNEASLVESKKTIELLGIKVSGYVTPNSVPQAGLLPTIKKVYGYAYTKAAPNKGVYPSIGFDKNVDPGELARVGVETWNKDEVNQAAIKNLIDWAVTNSKKITFYSHKLPSTLMNIDGVTSALTETDLRAILTYIRTKVDNGECLFVSSDEMMYQTYK